TTCSYYIYKHRLTWYFNSFSLHDALPISIMADVRIHHQQAMTADHCCRIGRGPPVHRCPFTDDRAVANAAIALSPLIGKILRQRSEEHTSELQSRENLVCRLLLEKKNKTR